MRIVRFRHGNEDAFGQVERGVVRLVRRDALGHWRPGEEAGRLEDVKLLPPCVPTKIVAVGLNYVKHIKESKMPVPQEPLLFLKPPSAVLGPGDRIRYPQMSKQVDYEGELAIVIGRQAKTVSEKSAKDYVLGYTCGNDVTARDLQRKDGQWTRAKGFDTFCPLGPAIVTDVDPLGLRIITRLNGETKQDDDTAEMIFGVSELVSYVSRIMTLEPFDVILTGTPCGVGPMKPGDVVEVEIEDIGTLTNGIA